VPVNQPIALLLEEGEEKSGLDSYQVTGAAPAPSAPAAPTASPVPAAAPAAPAARANGQTRIFASPLAKRLAQKAGIDLAAVAGSGPHGRIVKADIEAASGGPASGGVAPAAIAPPPATPVAAGPGARQLADALGMAYTLEPHSSMRRIIARRLSESKQTVPHFYLTVDCNIDHLLEARKRLNEQDAGRRISVNDFVIRAAALALKQVPAANASWDEAGVLRYDHADISVAVATPGGLITPIVKTAEEKGLAVISDEMKDLAGRAREGKLKPEEYQGGTFSISNLGMFGISEFSAIINPPQGCILAVGAGEQRPIVKNGALAVASMMKCTLSVDHRVVDGAVGAEFMAAFKRLLEDPLTMLL
jgi:pyruvate dehydrogenase E2 component (dihydrolipoamide acetyltransferase)